MILLCSPEKFCNQYKSLLQRHAEVRKQDAAINSSFLKSSFLPQLIIWDEAHLALSKHNGTIRGAL